MSLDLQEWLALLCVTSVAGFALWRRWTKKRSKGCNDCAVAQCGPGSGGKLRIPGVKADPYRPKLSRPMD